jgi:phosphoribosylaminoimidazole-succinocarboxamide synthase
MLLSSQTQKAVPNWVLSHPHPRCDFGLYAEPFPVEFIIRRYLTGSLLAMYKANDRQEMVFCGTTIAAGLPDNYRFETPIFTPTTKAKSGHDQNISPDEIIGQSLMTKAQLIRVIAYALDLFAKGEEVAASKDLTFVDTKYEFGRLADGQIILIDEVNTPDSSRYWGGNVNLSKEFLRQYLKEQNFIGEGAMPILPPRIINELSKIYVDLAEKLTGERLVLPREDDGLFGNSLEDDLLEVMAWLRATKGLWRK